MLIAILIFMFYRNIERANRIRFFGNRICAMEGGKSPKKDSFISMLLSPRLYQGPQSVSLIEVDPGAGLKVDVAVSDKMKETSKIALNITPLQPLMAPILT